MERLDIDSESVTWKRVLDVNDRPLRHIVTGSATIRKMPGLPPRPAFMDIELDGEGQVTGLNQPLGPRKVVAGLMTGSV